MTRIISGVALAVVSAAVIIWAPPVAFFIYGSVFAAIGLSEYFRMLNHAGEPSIPSAGIGGGLALFAAISLGGSIGALLVTPLVFISVMGASALLLNENSHRGASNTLFGAFYIGLTLPPLVLIRHMPDGVTLIFLLIFANTFCDSMAYYTGKNLGKTPLAPSISPKKTVEGFLGGLVGAVVASVAFVHFFAPGFGVVHAISIGLIAGFVGPVGDLAESSLKRRMGVKDSGSALPGHGGALDRLDSWIFTSPVFYLYIRFVMGA